MGHAVRASSWYHYRMDAKGAEDRQPARLLLLEDGGEATIGPAAGGEDGGLAALLQRREAHHVCHASVPLEAAGGSLAEPLVARARDGRLLGAAWLFLTAAPEVLELAVVLSYGVSRERLTAALLRECAARARAAGYEHLRTCLERETHDTIQDLRAAGFRVESCFTTGGSTEVVLGVPALALVRPLGGQHGQRSPFGETGHEVQVGADAADLEAGQRFGEVAGDGKPETWRIAAAATAGSLAGAAAIGEDADDVDGAPGVGGRHARAFEGEAGGVVAAGSPIDDGDEGLGGRHEVGAADAHAPVRPVEVGRGRRLAGGEAGAPARGRKDEDGRYDSNGPPAHHGSESAG